MQTRTVVAALVLAAALDADAEAVLFSTGPQINLPFGGAQGLHASQVQGGLGLTSMSFGGGSGGLGFGTFSTVVDDFVVPEPWSWQVSSFTAFALPSPFPASNGTLKLWDSAPWDAGAVALFSATATLTAEQVAYRVPSNDASVPWYPIHTYTLVGAWTLPPGHYWLSWAPAVVFLSPSTAFQPPVSPVTIPGAATTGNGRFRTDTCMPTCTLGPWTDALDAGAGTPQGFPFVVRGRPASIRKGDLGGPSGPDLVFRNVNAASPDFDRHKVWLMNGVVRAAEAYVVPDAAAASARIVASDDFDTAGAPWNGPDGQSDLLWRDASTGAMEFWLMNGTQRVGAPLPLTGEPIPTVDWIVAASADFNADGRPDLVWRNANSQQLVVWFLKGTAFQSYVLPTPDHAVNANWTLIAAQDYNDDGASDLLWYNESTGKLVTWYMNAAVQRTSGQFVDPPQAGDNNWKVVASGDYSRDNVQATPPLGSADVVWRNATSGRLVVWHLDFASTRVLGEFTSPDANTPALDWVVAGPK